MRIGITGQSGFIGTHLCNRLRLNPDFEIVPFEDVFFEDNRKLAEFVRQSNVIVHLDALHRHENATVIYDTNVGLVSKLIETMEREGVRPTVIFGSSTQETLDNDYGRSKLKGRELLEQWAVRNGANQTTLIIPNEYGEFARPNYNSFVATFADKFIRGEKPKIIEDNTVRLIYVGTLCRFIIERFSSRGIDRVEVPCDMEVKVSQVLALFDRFTDQYLKQGILPELKDINEVNLFNTYRSYIDPVKRFPVKLPVNSDHRGGFIEAIRARTGGQVSFSTTLPKVTRGNHYHTRKIERFIVIKGRAEIQMRRIGTDEVLTFELDGREPAYVDIPVWYSHNITNTGVDELYMLFWINEWYSAEDGDTYFEKV